MSRDRWSLVAVVATMVVWGLNFPFVKHVLDQAAKQWRQRANEWHDYALRVTSMTNIVMNRVVIPDQLRKEVGAEINNQPPWVGP